MTAEAAGIAVRPSIGAVRVPTVQWVVALVWGVPVVLTLLSADQRVIATTAMLAAVVSAAFIIGEPAATVIALPFFALLAPLAGFLDAGGIRLALSDLIFVVLGAQLFLLFITNRVHLRRTLHGSLLALLGSLFVLSTIAGVLAGTLQTLKPLLYLAEFFILYVYTAHYASDERMRSAVINAWLAATALGAVLLIHAYMSGVMLNDFDAAGGASGVDRSTLNYLFQATYYYTGFHYALGTAVVVSILKLFLEPARRSRALVVAGLPFVVVALVMMLNKTAMISAIVALVVTFAVLSRHIPARRMARILLITAIAAGTIVLFVAAVFLHYVGDAQGALWTRQATGVTSLIARTVVYVQAFAKWVTYPLQMVIGMGPDFLDNSGVPRIALEFKYSTITGGAEGTVDSGWISYLLELGALGFCTLAALDLIAIRRSLRGLGSRGKRVLASRSSLYVGAALFFSTIALSTQMLGYAKIAWLPFQMLALALVHRPARGDQIP